MKSNKGKLILFRMLKIVINLLWGLLSLIENIVPAVFIAIAVMGFIQVNSCGGYWACLLFAFSIVTIIYGIVLIVKVGKTYKILYRNKTKSNTMISDNENS